MTALNKAITGLVVVAVVLAVVAGFSTGPGNDAMRAAWEVVTTVTQWAAASLIRLSAQLRTAGDPVRALVAGLVVFAVTLLAPKVRGGGAALIAAVAVSLLFGLVMYQPSILAGVAV